MLQDGATPLFKAAHKGHVEVVHELLPYKPCLTLLKVTMVTHLFKSKIWNMRIDSILRNFFFVWFWRCVWYHDFTWYSFSWYLLCVFAEWRVCSSCSCLVWALTCDQSAGAGWCRPWPKEWSGTDTHTDSGSGEALWGRPLAEGSAIQEAGGWQPSSKDISGSAVTQAGTECVWQCG